MTVNITQLMAKNKLDISKKVKEIQKALTKIMTIAENDVKNHFVGSFRRQGWIDRTFEPWQKRRHSDRDTKRRGNRAVLVQSGDLRRSIRVSQRSKHAITFTSDLPYSSIHNYGGTTHPTVTPRMRGWARYRFKETKNTMFAAIANTKLSKLTVNIPKRKFMGNSVFLTNKVKGKIINNLNNAFKR